MPHRRLAVIAAAAVSIGLFAGCTSTPVSVAPTPTASDPAPTGGPTVEPAAEPSSRFTFDCDDVGGAISGLHTIDLAVSSTLPTADGRANWLQGPGQFTFAQSGDLYCEFGDRMDVEGAYAVVSFTADGEAAMADRVGTIGEIPEVMCHIQDGGGNCAYARVVDGVYVEVHAMGVTGSDTAAVEQAMRAAQAQLEAMAGDAVAPADWTAPSATVALGTKCDTIISREDLAALLSIPSLEILHPEGGWSIEAWMLSTVWSAEPCLYYPTGGDPWSGPTSGQLTWLPGGEWAYESNVSGRPLSIVGEGSDRAVLDCTTAIYYPCAVDILAGRNWVRFAFLEENGLGQEQLATSVAQSVIDTVRG